MLGFFVALLGQGILGGKALALVDGIIELGIGVAHLPAIDVEFEALDLGRIIGLFLGQGLISMGWSMMKVGWIILSSQNSSKKRLTMSPFLWQASYSMWRSS